MPAFRWPKLEHDVLLCREVVGNRPSRTDEWDVIASTLSLLFSSENSPVVLKGRGCREHVDLLVKKFKTDENASLKKYVEKVAMLKMSDVLIVFCFQMKCEQLVAQNNI